jgi:hypothetical protein
MDPRDEGSISPSDASRRSEAGPSAVDGLTGPTLEWLARDLGLDPKPRRPVGDWLPPLPHAPSNQEYQQFARVAQAIEHDDIDWRETLREAQKGCGEEQRRYLQHWALLMMASPSQVNFPRFPAPGF